MTKVLNFGQSPPPQPPVGKCLYDGLPAVAALALPGGTILRLCREHFASRTNPVTVAQL